MRVHVGLWSVFVLATFVAGLQVRDLGAQNPSASAGAQTATATTGTGLLMGTVVDGLSDRPVGGSLVTLLPLDRQVLTDAQGRFVFADLPQGAYSLISRKAGYVVGAYGQRRPAGDNLFLRLAETERIADLKVPIWKHATITGTITDEAGDPMIDIPVRVLSRTIVAGRRKLTPGVTVKTDDRGLYRIAGLTPGEYAVVVPSTQATAPQSIVDSYSQFRRTGEDPNGIVRTVTSNGLASTLLLNSSYGAIRVGDLTFQSATGSARAAMSSTLASDGRIFVYPTQYYPAATNAAQATAIPLQSGEERGDVNLQLKLVPTARVSGIITGPDGPAVLNLALVPSGDDLSTDIGLETATSISDANGRFTLLGVPAGQYVLRSVKGAPAGSRGSAAPAVPPGQAFWAAQSLSVGPADISDLVVTLRTGFRVTGTVAFDEAAEQPSADEVRRVVMSLESAGGRPPATGTGFRGTFDGAGHFTSYDLAPDLYYLRVIVPPIGWMLKSAMLDGRDISNVPVTLDRATTGVVMTFTKHPGEISGRVQNAAGVPDTTASVIVFPADNASWVDYGVSPRRLLSRRVDKDGVFRATGLPPGDYLVVAIPDEAAADVFDPRILQALSRLATPIKLTDGEARSISLRTVAVPR